MRTAVLPPLLVSLLAAAIACSSDDGDGAKPGAASGGSTSTDGGSGAGGAGGSSASGGLAGSSGSSGSAGSSGAAATGGTTAADASTCAPDVWSTLEACGWPGPNNTGPDLTRCPDQKLTDMGGANMPAIAVDRDGAVIECANVRGSLRVTAKNVVIRNSHVAYDSGKRGEDANATAPIFIEDDASVTIENVEIDGREGSHACIWHQGASMTARRVECYGVDDGIFTWASSNSAGDSFTIEDSYFHDLTPLTANGHMDGFQTEGAKNGLIRHNTYAMSAEGTSAIAIWNSLKSSSDIRVENNLLAGGGATVYAEDYDPSEQSPEGGFTVTNISFDRNTFSTRVSPCVGKYMVWFTRPQLAYGGGPTDGWKRTDNVVLETGENVDDGNPRVNGRVCN